MRKLGHIVSHMEELFWEQMGEKRCIFFSHVNELLLYIIIMTSGNKNGITMGDVAQSYEIQCLFSCWMRRLLKNLRLYHWLLQPFWITMNISPFAPFQDVFYFPTRRFCIWLIAKRWKCALMTLRGETVCDTHGHVKLKGGIKNKVYDLN